MIVRISICCMLVLSAVPALGQQTLQERIDSLFVIASSGEVQFRDQNEPAMDSIAAIGRPAVLPLIDKFTTRSARERWTIIWVLQRIGSEAVPDLVEALNRPNGLIVQRVCWALGDIQDTAAVVPLLGVKDHHRWQVRDQAMRAIGRIRDDRGADAVYEAFADSIGQVRKSAVVAAGKLGEARAIENLLSALDDPFYGARLMAVQALLDLDTAQVVAEIENTLNDEGGLAGSMACSVLGELGTPKAIELLAAQLGSMFPDRRAHAALALVVADPLDNCEYLRNFLAEEPDRLVQLKVHSAMIQAGYVFGLSSE